MHLHIFTQNRKKIIQFSESTSVEKIFRIQSTNVVHNTEVITRSLSLWNSENWNKINKWNREKNIKCSMWSKIYFSFWKHVIQERLFEIHFLFISRLFIYSKKASVKAKFTSAVLQTFVWKSLICERRICWRYFEHF